ncbi:MULTISPECIES: DUF5658 family protein [Halomicrobium]|uniref:DUF5658 domain-containing protein n=2 Tax=Halomicrobium mukohataei TaxID=57705 RepID=C7P168_HALMD|nr:MULTISPECIES: DUF5658 family protein [Halomicrobium]ACV49083.1 conserved hypothetical protein [Halomicrobium mukohataei DSM 12286]QCD64499.1 hypothetical protein E5139_02165 [Halomicrobium mukohataei]QFR19305.1 hypothetical protein GBQ70_02165 [Halomicrobium sp. ZPS1]
MDTATGSPPLDVLEPPAGLWLLALVFFGVGDLLTTGVGLTLGTSTEANPVVAPLVERYGVAVLLPIKAAFFVGTYLVWRALPHPYSTTVPATLALVGVVVTAWNTGMLLTGAFS